MSNFSSPFFNNIGPGGRCLGFPFHPANLTELNNFAWNNYVNANNDEIEIIKTAIKCSIRSIELNNNYANNDTYAWLLYKSGELKKALKQANKAIEIAKKNNEDYSETQKLNDTINKRK